MEGEGVPREPVIALMLPGSWLLLWFPPELKRNLSASFISWLKKAAVPEVYLWTPDSKRC